RKRQITTYYLRYLLERGATKHMKYSIIITYYQGYNILCTALELLHKSLKARKDVEIIVVNDNPQTSIHKIENLDPFQRLRVVDMEKNGGYSLACNKGVAI